MYFSTARRFAIKSLVLTISVTLFTLLGVLAPAWSEAEQSPLRVTMLDVKQGDAILIVTPSGKTILIDAADRTAEFKDQGVVKTYYPAFDRILPYLEQHGIKHIDQFIISHPHADHIGGLADIINNIEVREIVDSYVYTTNMYRDIVKLAREKGIKWTKVFRGDTLNWGDNIKTSVLHPPQNMDSTRRFGEYDDLDTRASINLNNVSIVLKVEYGKVSYLFTGDAEKEAEEIICSAHPDLHATVLKAAHHGSKTSSSPGFLEQIDCRYALVSVGEVNKFKHPDTAHTLPNIAHYTTKNHGALLRTDQKGTIETWTYGEDVKIAVEKGENVFIDNPRIVTLLPTSVTLEWSTSNPSTSEINIGGRKVILNSLTSKHLVTVTGLAPGTAYDFEAVSREQIGGAKKISSKGSFTTSQAGSAGEAGISFKKIQVSPATPYFDQKVSLTAILEGASDGLTVDFHRDFVSPATRLASTTLKSGKASATWKTSFTGSYILLAVVSRNGKPVLIDELKTAIHAKKVLIDTYHWNMHTFKNELSSLKLDLTKNGFEVTDSSKRLAAADLKDFDLLIVTDPGRAAKASSEKAEERAAAPQFNAAELNALSAYVKSGGNLLVTCQNDFKGNQEMSNNILAKIGAGFKFNDDTVIDKTHQGYERVLTLETIATGIVGKGIRQVLCSNSCSLMKADGNALLKDADGLVIVTRGNGNNVNKDTDGQNDALVYSADAAIPITACQELGNARIAAIGSSYQLSNSVYTHSSSHQTDLFNLRLIKWLTSGKAGRETFSSDQDMALLRSSGNLAMESEERDSLEEITMERIRDLADADDFTAIREILRRISESGNPDDYRDSVLKIMTLLTLHRMESGSSEILEETLGTCRTLLGQQQAD